MKKKPIKISRKTNSPTQEEKPLDPTLATRIDEISKTLAKQIDKETFKKKYAPVVPILKLVGAGAFFAATLAFPTLPMVLKPFLKNENEYNVWKRFNIPYLKRTLARLEKQKLVEISEKNGLQVVAVTNRGRKRILKCAIDELTIEKPKIWDGRWRLISYDIPDIYKGARQIFKSYLSTWNFYPLHESVFLHAYPCEKEIDFLKDFLGIGKYIRIIRADKIEDDRLFRDFFDV